MNELVIQLCERLKLEADAIDGVEHCQKVVLALSKCFFQQTKQEEGSE